MITNNNVPKISTKWPAEFQDFIDKCTEKNVSKRWTAKQLLDHPFLKGAQDLKDQWKAEYKNW